jgi:hypothetical protein
MLTHIQTLPTLHTLRLCNRFGHGRFKDFPVELVKMIEGHVASSVREKLAERSVVASRCFRNDCSLIDHADRETLTDLYRKGVESLQPDDYSPPRTPNDEQLMDLYRDDVESFRRDDHTDTPNDEQLTRTLMSYYKPFARTGIDEHEVHQLNRIAWPTTIGGIFSKANREMFLTNFGLDIWFSFVRLGGRYRQT